jgi:predicted amidohydrolase YtcJ
MEMKLQGSIFAGALIALVATSAAQARASGASDIIYSGGDIISVDPANPSPQAVAVKKGLIVAVGSRKAVERAWRGPQTQMRDLAGMTLMPSFIDPHSHIAQQVARWGVPTLSPPPVGDVTSIADIVVKLKAYIANTPIPAGTPVLAMGYDDSLLKEGHHPTAIELDQISTDHPIALIHQSGHLGAVNSAMLALMGYTKATPNPMGGVIRRTAQGDPDGVLEELALMPLLRLSPPKPMDEQIKTLGQVQAYYASLGITTAQEGIASFGDTALLQAAASHKALILDIVSYERWDTLKDLTCDGPAPMIIPNQGEPMRVGIYQNRLKIGGVKLTGDGSPQGKTAYLTAPYVHPPHGLPDDYRGYPVATAAASDRWFAAGARCKVQVLFHANGDAAADMMLASVAKAQAQYGKSNVHPVMIHAQMIRHDQVDQMADLGIIPSFFTEHTYFWGDWHINETVGQKRAFGMSPAGYALSKGMTFTIHTDAPVLPPNHLTAIWTAVNRVSRSGVVVGPDERISVMEAIKAVTINSAYQYGEQTQKGSITPGKLADLIILDQDPLKVDPMAIKDIKVVETIKEGQTIYKRP